MPVELKTSPASDTWRSMMTAYTRISRKLAIEMEDENELPLEWYPILLMLSQTELGSMRPSDLAEQMGLSRSATTRLIDRLESDELVERSACASDRRGTFVTLTPRGEQKFLTAGRTHLRGIDEHVGTHLTDSELRQLETLLTKLADGVEGEALSMISPETTD
ncbi:MAG: MarR family winged helix-turn-helix transcriptional regulator [Acidimicrobiia bacterium]